MEAGSDLDKLIAEKVFGLEPRVFRLKRLLSRKEVRLKELCEERPYRINGTFKAAPKYSTDITVAWQLIGKLNSLGWDFSIEVDHEFKENQVAIEKKVEDAEFTVSTIGPFYFLGATASHAICLAALRAIDL